MGQLFAGFRPDLFVYAAIGIVTLIGFWKCILPVLQTTRGLNKAIRKLEESAGSETTALWHDETFVGKSLQATWQKFLLTEDEMEKRGLACPVEDYINTRTVTKVPGNASLSELIPSLLTSLGILGTFIGLTRGLTGLDMTDANTLMNGIPILLDGMKAAFGTSVAGISCSLIFSMLNRALQGNSYHAIDNFIEVFTLKSGHKALDSDYQMVLQSNDRNRMLDSVTAGLPQSITDTVRGIVTETVDPITEAMEKHIQTAKAMEMITEDTVRLQKTMDGICRSYQEFLDRLQEKETKNEVFAEASLKALNAMKNYESVVSATAINLNSSLKTFSDSIVAMNAMINQKMAENEVEKVHTAEQLEEIKQLLTRLAQKKASSSDPIRAKNAGGKETAEA